MKCRFNLKIRKEGVSLLLVVLIGFSFLSLISYAFIFSSTSERKQTFYNIEQEKVRGLSEACLKACISELLEKANTPGDEIFEWFRNSSDKASAPLKRNYKDLAEKLYLDDTDRISVEDVVIEMKVCEKFTDAHKLDSDKLEKRGLIQITTRAGLKVPYRLTPEKFQHTAGYDFKVSLVMLPIIQDNALANAELNKWAMFVRNGTSFIDDDPEGGAKLTVENDPLKKGFLFFGSHNGLIDGKILNPLTYEENTKIGDFEYKKQSIFNQFDINHITMNNPVLSKIENLDWSAYKLPLEKISRWYPTGDSFLSSASRNGILELDGLQMVDNGFAIAAGTTFRGYSLTLTRNTVHLERYIEKKDPDSCWIILNCCTDSGDGPNIYVGEKPVKVTVAPLYGELKTSAASRKIIIGGGVIADKFDRHDSNPVNGNIARDPNLLFPFDSSTKKKAYSVSLSHAASYLLTKRM